MRAARCVRRGRLRGVHPLAAICCGLLWYFFGVFR